MRKLFLNPIGHGAALIPPNLFRRTSELATPPQNNKVCFTFLLHVCRRLCHARPHIDVSACGLEPESTGSKLKPSRKTICVGGSLAPAGLRATLGQPNPADWHRLARASQTTFDGPARSTRPDQAGPDPSLPNTARLGPGQTRMEDCLRCCKDPSWAWWRPSARPFLE